MRNGCIGPRAEPVHRRSVRWQEEPATNPHGFGDPSPWLRRPRRRLACIAGAYITIGCSSSGNGRQNNSSDIEDDDLVRFEAHGAGPLPATGTEGWLDHDGARIWHASYGDGPPVVLLHGGLGHAGNWGYQVPAIVSAGYRVIVIDSRGHGRSTRDARPYSYERMASDVLAVMDALGIDSARFVGWSDGACIALVLAARAPSPCRGRVLLRAQHGSGRYEEGGAGPRDRSLLHPLPQGLREPVGHAGRI